LLCDDVTDSVAAADRLAYRIRYAPHEPELAEPEVNGPWHDLLNRVKFTNVM
jgi:hypothetical protein